MGAHNRQADKEMGLHMYAHIHTNMHTHTIARPKRKWARKKRKSKRQCSLDGMRLLLSMLVTPLCRKIRCPLLCVFMGNQVSSPLCVYGCCAMNANVCMCLCVRASSMCVYVCVCMCE